MRIIRLYDKEGKPMIGSDSIMKIDGRFRNTRTQLEIQERNTRYRKNFPHLMVETDLAEEVTGVPVIQMLEKPINFSDVVFIASESFEIEAIDSGIKETYYISPVWEF